MCKAKPGPRCSDHAAAEWRTTHSSLLTKQHEVEEARNSLAQAREYNAKTLTVESENLVVGWENYVNQKETEIDAITTKNENAMLNFYSTPSGQKILENEIVKNEGFQKKVNDGYFNDEGEWAGVSYRENKIYEPSILLRSAIAHRKKQKEYYDQIHTGNVSSFQKLALIEHQTKQAKAEKTFMENHLSVCENETSKALAHAVNYPYDSKAIDNLRNAKRELYVTQTRLKFIALQVKDLETAAKNIPHTEIKPDIFKPSPTPINQTQQQPLTYENIKKLMEG